MISVALNAKIRKVCREAKRVIKLRCRSAGSILMWCWLARIISGRSQQVRTSRGVDRGSVAIYKLVVVQPVSKDHLIKVKLIRAITRLWVVMLVHNHLGEESQIVGNSMMVGIRIFSIVVGSGL